LTDKHNHGEKFHVTKICDKIKQSQMILDNFAIDNYFESHFNESKAQSTTKSFSP